MASPDSAPRRSAPAPSGRRERRRAEIRERLFRAALKLFAERGYLQTTVEDITEAADVGKGTFFNYFPTKEHVLATFGSERIAIIERARKEVEKEPALPVLRRMARDLARSGERPGLLRAIYAAHASCEPVRAELHKRLLIARRLTTEIYEIAQERGEVRRDIPAAELARLTQLILLGITLAWSMNPESSLHDATTRVWDIWLPSLAAEGKRKGAPGCRGTKT